MEIKLSLNPISLSASHPPIKAPISHTSHFSSVLPSRFPIGPLVLPTLTLNMEWKCSAWEDLDNSRSARLNHVHTSCQSSVCCSLSSIRIGLFPPFTHSLPPLTTSHVSQRDVYFTLSVFTVYLDQDYHLMQWWLKDPIAWIPDWRKDKGLLLLLHFL